MTPREFLERRAGGAELKLLDVREDWETTLAPVPADHVHIPMGQIADRLGELDPAQETVVICRSGGPQRRGGAFPLHPRLRLGVQPGRRDSGVVSRLGSKDPAVLTGEGNLTP